MTTRQKELMKRFHPNPPALPADLQSVEAALNFRLPPAYAAFLRSADGGEGFVGESYLILFRAGELERLNSDYVVAEFAPGLILFGSNGGGEAYAFDTRSPTLPVVRVPFVGMDLAAARAVAPAFDEFFERISHTW